MYFQDFLFQRVSLDSDWSLIRVFSNTLQRMQMAVS